MGSTVRACGSFCFNIGVQGPAKLTRERLDIQRERKTVNEAVAEVRRLHGVPGHRPRRVDSVDGKLELDGEVAAVRIARNAPELVAQRPNYDARRVAVTNHHVLRIKQQLRIRVLLLLLFDVGGSPHGSL